MLEEFKNDSKISDIIGIPKDSMYSYYIIISKKINQCDHLQNKIKLKKDILLTYDGHENFKKNLQVCKNQVIESIYVLEQKCSSQKLFYEILNFNDPILIDIINEGNMLCSGDDKKESSNSSMYSTNLCDSQKNYINELNSSFID
ncbi:hypothetical protein A3Q56_08170 [Intoshia linei]|uniref:Uncharacterized protein n=1 Tax=Intoshia linei TaxID=1819745 RepID=A0A177ASA9_9BILA|nr:hypothetical protein A3Q56_08170 [Intoshia linei]